VLLEQQVDVVVFIVELDQYGAEVRAPPYLRGAHVHCHHGLAAGPGRSPSAVSPGRATRLCTKSSSARVDASSSR
jgi:hypothetical protein